MRIFLWIAGGVALLIALAFLFLGDPEAPRDLLMRKYGGPPSQFAVLPSGATAHYRDQGNAQGPALLLVHGSNASLHTWENWAKILGDAFRVVSVDLPGHGLTVANADEDYTIASMAAFADEFSTTIGLARFAVAGNSMGGHVGARLALKTPSRVNGLILIDSGGVIPSDMPAPPAFYYISQTPVLREFLRLIPTRAPTEAALKAMFVNQALVTQEMVDRYWDLNRGPGIRAATRTRFRMPLDYWLSEDKFLRANLPTLKVPTLILWGRQDKLVPVSAAAILKELIPGAQAIIYDDAGHLPHEDVAERSAAAARAFLQAEGEAVR